MSLVRYEVSDPVAVITLSRPAQLNALTYPMLAEFRARVEEAEADERVVGIIVTGDGRGFCAGLDAEVLKATTSPGGKSVATEGAAPRPDDVPGLFTYLLKIRKPIIAAVNGPAAGGGFILAVMSDIRIASTAASFTTVFSKRGLLSEHGSTWILPRIVGTGRALDLLWSSRKVDAQEALRIGLVNEVVEPGQLLARAKAYVKELADFASPGSFADTKALVYRHMGIGYPEALREADKLQWEVIARPDALEGAMSLIERRPPKFQRLGKAKI
ncbi:enoyl-CoA hydratase [Hyaloraphidium curvatum]|nr:enoyl-CoA hydratase [Hyaloraphidium curvatum]